MRWPLLVVVCLTAFPGATSAQTCNGQDESVILVQASAPAGVAVEDLVTAAGHDITILAPSELAAADLDGITRIIVSSAQGEELYADLAAATPRIEAWLAAECCRVLQWHGHAGPETDLPGWHDAPAGLVLGSPATTFDRGIIVAPGHPLVTGVPGPLSFPDPVFGARGVVDTDAAVADVIIAEEQGGALLIDFEAGPSRIVATTIHVEVLATHEPALLDNLLAAQADEAHCDTGDDDDSGGDDDDSAADDDDSAGDDDDTQADDDDTQADDDDTEAGDDDADEAFARCETRDEYGLICAGSPRNGSAAALVVIAVFAWVRRREAI